jgi:hypothetical protein
MGFRLGMTLEAKHLWQGESISRSADALHRELE